MKKLIILMLIITWGKSHAQLATIDAAANKNLAALNVALGKSNTVQGSMNTFLNKSFTTLGDMKASAKDLLGLTKEYQDALSAVNAVITNSQQVNGLFEDQNNVVRLYTNNVYRYDRYFPSKIREEYHTVLKNGLAGSFKILKKADIILKPNFLKMNDNERFQQLDAINKEMSDLQSGMQSYINIYTRYGELLRTNPKAAAESAKTLNN